MLSNTKIENSMFHKLIVSAKSEATACAAETLYREGCVAKFSYNPKIDLTPIL